MKSGTRRVDQAAALILLLMFMVIPTGARADALSARASAPNYAPVGGPAWGFTVEAPAAWYYGYRALGAPLTFRVPNPTGGLALTVGGASQELARPGQLLTSLLPAHSQLLGYSHLRLSWGTGIATTVIRSVPSAGALRGVPRRELHAVVAAHHHFYHLYVVVTPAVGTPAEATAWTIYRHMLYSLTPLKGT